MSGTLVVAEHVAGRLRDVTRELITAAQELPRPVAVAVIAADPAALADAVDLEGVDEVIAVTAGGDEFENDVYQDAVEALIVAREPEVVVLGFTVNSMGFAPAVAAKLGLGYASDVFAFSVSDGGVVAARLLRRQGARRGRAAVGSDRRAVVAADGLAPGGGLRLCGEK